LSVVVPTRNEAPNVAVLTERLSAALDGLAGGWELVFVDDSDDNTPEVVSALARSDGAPVRLLHRPRGARPGGLGGALQEGFAIARGRVIAVMDADLQHPPEVLPAVAGPALAGTADLVAGSRYGRNGRNGGLDGRWRRVVSRGSRWLAHCLVPASRPLEDPGSGLFALQRSVLDGVDLRPDGFKMLLEVAARGNWRTAANVNYTFAERYAGNSNAGIREGLVFFRHLARLALTSRSGGRDRAAPVSTSGPALTTAPARRVQAAAVKLP
jgi:glycosyltransferase involved in cell wall biosynthesis